MPPQKEEIADPAAIEPPFTEMSSSRANEFIVRDIAVAEGRMRWTNEHPELRFILPSAERQAMLAEIGIVEATLKQTGPITIAFEINGRVLYEQRFESAGVVTIRKPVPAGWLKARDYNRLSMRANRVYVAADGAKLGFVLFRAGFVPDE